MSDIPFSLSSVQCISLHISFSNGSVCSLLWEIHSGLCKICKDKDEAEVWFAGLRTLISRSHHRRWRMESRSDAVSSGTNSPRTYSHRSSPLSSPFASSDSMPKVLHSVLVSFSLQEFLLMASSNNFYFRIEAIRCSFKAHVEAQQGTVWARHTLILHCMQGLLRASVLPILPLDQSIQCLHAQTT